MATLAMINKMIPDIYDGSVDVEIFIGECKRYFQLCGLEQSSQGMMIKCLISRELLPIYEAIEEDETCFEDRLKKAFKKPTTLIGDFLTLCNYEKNEDTAPVYFEKIEKMVDQVLKHKWDKKELMSYFLVHCIKDKDTQKEIKMRDAMSVEEIKGVIKKVDDINIEVSGISVLSRKKETFANIVKTRQGFADRQNQSRNFLNTQRNAQRSDLIPRLKTDYFNKNFQQRETPVRNRPVMTCWNCQEVGHMSRECRKPRIQKCFQCGKEGHQFRECNQRVTNVEMRCFACKDVGHNRSECPSISCSGCGKRGHLRFQCWNQTDRRRYADEHRPPRRTQVAAFQTDRAENAEKSSCQDEDYPNREAPSLGEMIGAMN